MKAIVYNVNPLGWATCHWLRHLWPGCLATSLNGLSLKDIPPPELPGPDWVRLRTLLGGICGTDLGIITHSQPANSILQAFSSCPMVLGHENVALVDHIGGDVDPQWKGRRVCVEPTLSCKPRGIEPVCSRCSAGEFGACENFAADGIGAAHLPPGTSIGYNRRTSGSYSEYFVAHQSQLVAVPDALSDELAVLTDPVACGAHAVLRCDLTQARNVLVYGAGALGLAVIAALRAVEFNGTIDALDIHTYTRQLARQMGADHALELGSTVADRFQCIADRTGASIQRSRFNNYMLSGGYDVIFDCVGTPQSVNEGLKWTRARGQLIIVGTSPGGAVDLTPIWFRELSLHGAYGRQDESIDGRRIGTYQLVHEWIAQGRLDVRPLLTHTFPLAHYRPALHLALNKSRRQAIKIAFDFR